MSDYIGASPAYGVFQRQVLTGDGSTTQFNLDYAVAQPTSLMVVLDGVVQEPEYSYDTSIVNGQPVITFSEAPDAAGRVSVIYMGRQLLTAQSANSNTHIDEFNGDGSSNSYTGAGSVITFTSAPPAGTNNIQVIQLNGSNTLNTVANGSVSRVKLDFDPEDDATALAIA